LLLISSILVKSCFGLSFSEAVHISAFALSGLTKENSNSKKGLSLRSSNGTS
jgi:hypothetical protein